jgi:hypothetical protein
MKKSTVTEPPQKKTKEEDMISRDEMTHTVADEKV